MFIVEVAKALKAHKVDYAVVGGLAVAFHNVVRGTFDLDIIIKISQKSFENTEKALTSIGLVPRLPVTAKDVFNFRKEYIENRNLIAWSFYNPKSPQELVDVIITHDAGTVKTKTIKIEKTDVLVIEFDDLIAMKKQSGRPQDLDDIKALLEVRKSKS